MRIGNGAASQLQLDVYGEVLTAAALFAASQASLDRDHGRRIAEIADLVCDLWQRADAGIWEVRSEPAHFTQSKMMCAIALDRAVDLAEAGTARRSPRALADGKRDVCASSSRPSATRRGSGATHGGGHDALDASLLLAVLAGYDRATRLASRAPSTRFAASSPRVSRPTLRRGGWPRR